MLWINRIVCLGMLGLIVSVWAGCGSGGKVAAVVNGEVITVSDVAQRMAQMGPAARSVFGDDPQRILEQMILETLLLQEARRQGVDRQVEVIRLIRDARRQILIGRLLEMVKEKNPPTVTEEEIRQYYNENPKRFVLPEEFRASHILVPDEKTAQEALKRLRAGEPFQEVARQLSVDPTRTQGGDIGFFKAGDVIPEFEAACRALEPGKISDVVKTHLGYHVILLTERRAEGRKSLEEAKDEIRAILVRRKQEQQLEEMVKGLRDKAQVHVREGIFQKPAGPAAPPNPTSSQSPSSAKEHASAS
jgi:peptidyl-prolyl cis-trans isomerase C